LKTDQFWKAYDIVLWVVVKHDVAGVAVNHSTQQQTRMIVRPAGTTTTIVNNSPQLMQQHQQLTRVPVSTNIIRTGT
jgi:hypothetical protein